MIDQNNPPTNAVHTTWRCSSYDGLSLFFQGWQPDQPARAVVCLVHGLGEHSSRYPHLAARFNQAGLALVAFDHRGHGQSTGARGHCPTGEAYLEDIDLLLSEGRRLFPGLPVFLYGHSMGGYLVLYYGLKRKADLAGVISTSPGLHTVLEQQSGKVWLVRTLGSALPGFSLATGLDAGQISRDPAVVAAYRQDPLVHGQVTASWGKCSLDFLPWIRSHAGEFDLPLLLMHGTGDQLAFASGSQEFAAQVKGDVTLKLWDGLAHELHNEPEQEQVFAAVLEWIETHLPN